MNVFGRILGAFLLRDFSLKMNFEQIRSRTEREVLAVWMRLDTYSTGQLALSEK